LGSVRARDTSFGQRLFQDKADCGFSHGIDGDGRGDPRSPGQAANLHNTRKSRTCPNEALLMFSFMVGACAPRVADRRDRRRIGIAFGVGADIRSVGHCRRRKAVSAESQRQACHGWAGDGRKMDTQMPDGANLRESALNRQDLVMTIKCGRPGTGMPAFDSDGRCYGLKQADLRSSGSRMPDPPATLQQREIDMIVDFLTVKVVKQGPMDHAKCIEFWGSEAEACSEFAK
jgi:hypothetical protein